MWFVAKILISGILISLSSWLVGKSPRLAGLIIALPLTSMIALALSYIEYRDPSKSIEFAKSIFLAVPLSLLFFLPFIFADKLKMSFWVLFGAGTILLAGSYTVHRAIFR